jgi:hypothetical protein
MLMWRLHGRTMPVFTGMTAKGKSLFERTCGAPQFSNDLMAGL